MKDEVKQVIWTNEDVLKFAENGEKELNNLVANGLKTLIENEKVKCEGVVTNVLNSSVDDNGNIVLEADDLI